MEKNAFLRELALILRDRGLNDDEIRVRIEKISSFIDGLSAEERNAVIGGNPNVAAIADRLFSRDGATQKHTDPAKAPDPAHAPDRSGSQARAKEHVTPRQDSEDKPTPDKDKKDGFRITSDYKKGKPEHDTGEGTSAGKNVAEIRRRDEEKLRALKSEAQRPKRKSAASPAATLAQRYEQERNFWVIFFCCIPILFFFGAVLLSAFALMFFALIALILLLIAALAVTVALGTGVSLICIIYGLAQIISSGGVSAVALYEAGMGLLVAGVTMLAGVLIYNAAIRFIPWTMKQLRRFFKFILKKLGVLAEYLKGVCASI